MKFDPGNDPFQQLVDVDHLIYQHLSGSDVLKASLVSSGWNQNIANSSTCMSKISLKVNSKSSSDPSSQEVTTILRSQRQYSSIKFSCNYKTNINNRAKIITKFAGSAVELKIYLLHPETPMEAVRFPKLKSLKIRSELGDDLLNKVFSMIDETKLETLTLWCNLPDEVISNFPKNLKELQLDWTKINIAKYPDVPFLCQLRLTKLRVYSSFHNNNKSLVNFLESQAETLECLSCWYFDSATIKTVVKMPKLRRLCLLGMGSIKPISVSESIVSLAINSHSVCCQIIPSVPNVKEIYLHYLNNDVLKKLAEDLKKLERIYCKCHQSGIFKFYDKLKRSDANINYNIKVITVSGRFNLFKSYASNGII